MTVAGPLGPRRPTALPAAARLAAHPQQQRRRRTRLLPMAASQKVTSEVDLYQPVAQMGVPAPPPPPPPSSGGMPLVGGQPWYVAAPLALLGVIAAARTARAIKKRM